MLPRQLLSQTPRQFFVALLLCLFTAGAVAEDRKCDPPQAPEVPDGAKSSESELIAAQQDVKEYVAQGEFYLGCLKNTEQELGEEITEEEQQQLLGVYNQVVDEMQRVSEQFNKAVQDYQAQQ